MVFQEKYKRLMGVIEPADRLGILISADPDAMASALALKRLFWRKAKEVIIYHINTIERPDNLAFIKLLKINLQHIRNVNRQKITKWAVVDSQPHHNPKFMDYSFDIIIDHHPKGDLQPASFIDIRDEYGATSSMLTEYLQAANISPSERMATALCYGIKTDTNNFIRHFIFADINAFRYVVQIANMNIIKKIESSEITRNFLKSLRFALDNLKVKGDMAFVHMDTVKSPDNLVIIADFFMKLDEVNWSVVSGLYKKSLVIIFRNSGLGKDAGRLAQDLFGKYGGSAGGHKEAARVELPLSSIIGSTKGKHTYFNFVRHHLESIT